MSFVHEHHTIIHDDYLYNFAYDIVQLFLLLLHLDMDFSGLMLLIS